MLTCKLIKYYYTVFDVKSHVSNERTTPITQPPPRPVVVVLRCAGVRAAAAPSLPQSSLHCFHSLPGRPCHSKGLRAAGADRALRF